MTHPCPSHPAWCWTLPLHSYLPIFAKYCDTIRNFAVKERLHCRRWYGAEACHVQRSGRRAVSEGRRACLPSSASTSAPTSAASPVFRSSPSAARA